MFFFYFYGKITSLWGKNGFVLRGFEDGVVPCPSAHCVAPGSLDRGPSGGHAGGILYLG